MKVFRSKGMISTILFFISVPGLAVGQTKIAWEIGKADNDSGEFALGPGGYNQYLMKFPSDVLFVVGQSDSKQDWPYVQPGPVDAWAGSKSHTFTILFGINKAGSGEAELELDFVDTHAAAPPKVQVKVNDTAFVYELPKGAGDASVFGEPTKGHEHKLSIRFPAQTLKTGNNTITITTLRGSWVLYDQVSLKVADNVETGAVEQTTKVLDVNSQPFLVEQNDKKLYQPVNISILHVGNVVEATIGINGVETIKRPLKAGMQVVEALVGAVADRTSIEVDVKVEGKSIEKRTLPIEPVRKWKVYMLPHSHVDIGYTRVQTEVEQLHWKYLEQAMELSERSADYPAGSQFKWNVEVLWAVDSYLKQASEQKRQQFIEAVKKGQIGLDALYGNELTALCRQEELVRLLDYSRKLSRRYNVTIDSAMISDVPGYTWGIVPALSQSGVKYFSVGPNRDARIGFTLSAWADKPFYWMSPSRQHKVLCWVAGQGYSWFLAEPGFQDRKIFNYLKDIEKTGYPYDIVQVRYTIGGDNGPPDPCLADFVKSWNARYVWPKLIIATTSEMFHEFERQYAKNVPTFSGDFTPYWEDGAASSAIETGLNRAAAERLVQSEALWAMLNPRGYPAKEFYTAWRNVILYDEHTWGAHCSISEPDSEFTNAQWKIKQAFALDADSQSRKLLNDALSGYRSKEKEVTAIDVFNTCSWARTDVVVVSRDLKPAGDVVKDNNGRKIGAQRLSSGELAFLAENVPAFGAKRFIISPGKGQAAGKAKAEGAKLSNSEITVSVDEITGAIKSIRWKEVKDDIVDNKTKLGLNDYFYVPGANPKDAKRNGQVKIGVKESGPLVASLSIESEAPGCNKLTREVRIVDGLDRIDIINVVDKKKIYEKEGVHFCFPFNVPNGVMRMDIPWAVVRPETDQLAGACKNWFTIQRWVDVSNKKYGVTWVTVNAPLVEVGAITAETPWIKVIEPSQTIYSYVMNNYWFTNYRAYQEGRTTFRYSVMPHRRFSSAQASKFGIEQSQPLVAVPVESSSPIQQPLLSVKSTGVIVTSLKPSEDGQARIVRMFNVSGRVERAILVWAKPAPKTVWLSNFAEEEISKIRGTMVLAAYEIVTLRLPLSEK